MIVGLLTHYQEMLPIIPLPDFYKIKIPSSGSTTDFTDDLVLMRKMNDERLSFFKNIIMKTNYISR